MALAAGGKPLCAQPFDLGDGWQGSLNTTVSVGSTWRADNRDSRLFKKNDGASIGLSGGTGGASSDANTLNYDQGDQVSAIGKLVSDLEIKRDEMGGLVRFKAWYDAGLNYNSAQYGNQANNYTRDTSLSDSGFENLQKFEGVQLLDAYVYNTFDVADRPLQIRLGRQVINWGESLFFQGVNQVNPLDVPALRRPGSEIKEGLMPVWAANANVGLGGGVSVESFYQFMWEPTAADACGTYWSTMDISVGSSAGNCNKVVVGSKAAANAISSGSYAPLVDGRDAKKSGEFGASVKVPVDLIDTEFGLYGMNVHSRTPIISGRTGSWGNVAVGGGGWTTLGGTLNPLMAAQWNQGLVGGSGVKAASAFWEYPEDMQVYGVSAATTLFGWSVGAELSYTPNLPVQRNGNDLLNGMLAGKGPLGSIFKSAASLTDVDGYDRLSKTQFQINGVKAFGGILGAAKSTVAGEAAFQWNNAPDYRDGTSIRYGRSFIFGTASSATDNSCSGGSNPNQDGCKNDGFVTPFAWGYRLRGSLEFPNIFDTPVSFIPSLSIAHDVQGVSADGQMNEGRFQTGLGARFTYDRRYNLDLNYVNYADWAIYDPLRDHDFYSVSVSTTF
jgi:hypothetical protein